jgi:hypothetical protein
MVIASQTLVLFGWSLGLQVLAILGCLLSVVSVGILLFFVNAWSGTKPNPSYDWQPELSHNVTEYWSMGSGGGSHALITKVPKSQEQLDEEKRAYLKERKDYD